MEIDQMTITEATTRINKAMIITTPAATIHLDHIEITIMASTKIKTIIARVTATTEVNRTTIEVAAVKTQTLSLKKGNQQFLNILSAMKQSNFEFNFSFFILSHRIRI